ncbi:MAG: hypothetical protein A2Y57_01605 [Candidatus Woykebacteria bacterium RBG_13_40_7b]|uniref:Methyltransferase type 11 domain-containing protein n=1 Tax=Candidatus Woykebacteria bacterium RBG_13_40_7b TaxID=1802594 RepID=A0A1G1W7A1_9BACT|nr:MAG: hypothetical protein A2Y57_01605 [Candidatus Woykebacteria bacterium RBG_13_40_7b]
MKESQNNQNKLIKFSFDLYTRLYYVSSFLNNRESKNKKLEILDVGGRDGKLAEFLERRKFNITVLDIREKVDEKDYIVGNILNPPEELGEARFDIVTGFELLEHIKQENREDALKQMFKLTKDIVILSAPFYSEETSQAEKFVNNLHKELNGEEHPWLKEHFESGLPDRRMLEEFFSEKGYDFFSVGSNNINSWLLMQLFGLSRRFNTGRKKYDEVVKFYNQNFEELGDSIEPTYRRVYFVSKKGFKGDHKLLNKADFNSKLYNDLIILVFTQLYKSMIGRETELSELIDSVHKLEKNLVNKGTELDELKTELPKKNAELDTLKRLVNQKNAELDSIYRSKSWKLLKVFRKAKNLMRKNKIDVK